MRLKWYYYENVVGKGWQLLDLKSMHRRCARYTSTRWLCYVLIETVNKLMAAGYRCVSIEVTVVEKLLNLYLHIFIK